MCSSNRKGSAAPRRSFKRNAAPVECSARKLAVARMSAQPPNTPVTHPFGSRLPLASTQRRGRTAVDKGGNWRSGAPHRDMPSRPVSIVEPCASNVSSTREIPFEGHSFDVPALMACPDFGPIRISGPCRISGACRDGVSGSGAISRPARGGVGHRCSG